AENEAADGPAAEDGPRVRGPRLPATPATVPKWRVENVRTRSKPGKHSGTRIQHHKCAVSSARRVSYAVFGVCTGSTAVATWTRQPRPSPPTMTCSEEQWYDRRQLPDSHSSRRLCERPRQRR